MTSSEELREQIAIEAARLMLRGKEQDFASARKRAARWLKRKRLRRDEIPSNQEIQVQLYALSGLMSAERDPATLQRRREVAAQLLDVLQPWSPTCRGAGEEAIATPGAELIITAAGPRDVIRTCLQEAGFDARVRPLAADNVLNANAEGHAGPDWMLELRQPCPCRIEGYDAAADVPKDHGLSADRLSELLLATPSESPTFDEGEHPDAFAVFEMLLEPLARVKFDPVTHPEGDALYHTLQVFELGREERPYDEEFLLACLLHDVGWAINPRHPVLSAIDALGTLVTERTRWLIEQRPVASHYLRTGECPRSVRRSEDFEDLVLLARCDRAGRIPGARVGTLAEAFDYLAELEQQWEE